MNTSALGKGLLIAALVLGSVGVVLMLLGAAGVRLPFGRLPGDLSWRRGNVRIYAPLATSLAISVVLTILFNVFARR